MLSKYKISGISTDRLVQMLQVGMPEFGLVHEMNQDHRVLKLKPLIQGLLTYHAAREDFVIEGVDILPEDVSEYVKYANGYLKACFIGTCSVTTQQKVLNIKQFLSYNDWTQDMNDVDINALAAWLIQQSQKLKSECEKFDLKYFDTSSDFTSVMELAANYLKSKDQ